MGVCVEIIAEAPDMKSLNQHPNPTQDGRWTYTWDAENRLVRLVANTGVGPQQRLDFAYDSQGRRIGKKVWNNTAGTGSPAVELQFVYDGWNLVAELTPAHATLRTCTWGLDLSGSEHGTGGVGGLISMTVPQGASAGTYFYAYDGNGNVVALVTPATAAWRRGTSMMRLGNCFVPRGRWRSPIPSAFQQSTRMMKPGCCTTVTAITIPIREGGSTEIQSPKEAG